MIYLYISANTEDSQLRNVLINDVTVIVLELITLKIYLAILRSNNYNVHTFHNTTYNIIMRSHW